MSDYLEKLRDPRWQKMRLKILERDGWKCAVCEDANSTLHVHHKYYERGCDPWDYPETALVTLCEACHKKETEQREAVEIFMIQILRRVGALNQDLDNIATTFIESCHNQIFTVYQMSREDLYLLFSNVSLAIYCKYGQTSTPLEKELCTELTNLLFNVDIRSKLLLR
jgi:hypothetical protein